MPKHAKDAEAFSASAVALLGKGSTYVAAPVRFDGAHTLVAEDGDDVAFPLVVVVAPARVANQITLINRTRWPVVFSITRWPDQPGGLGEIEVGPGETHHARAD